MNAEELFVENGGWEPQTYQLGEWDGLSFYRLDLIGCLPDQLPIKPYFKLIYNNIEIFLKHIYIYIHNTISRKHKE